MIQQVRITRQRSDDSCYEFEVRNEMNGRKSRAFLTCELFPSQSSERNLLLCEDDQVFMTFLTSLDEKSAYGTLNQLLITRKDQRFGVTKSIVNQLVEKEIKLEGIRIAVHTFGPVPVVVINEQLEISIHGRLIRVHLATFPKPKSNNGSPAQGFPSFISTKSEFRKCMSVSPHLVFARYLEDVAEDFHDIRRTLRRVDFYRRARNIEKTLVASIKTKLAAFIPTVSLAKARASEDREAWKFFSENSGILYETTVARYWALFLLNEIYQTTGVFSQSKKYRAKINECHNHFLKLLGHTRANNIREESRVLQYLDECQEAYWSVDFSQYYSSDLFKLGFSTAQKLFSLAKDAPSLWAKEFTKFAAFALIARTFQGSDRFLKIFLSHHHEVPASETVRDQIIDYAIEKRWNKLAILTVHDLPSGAPFRHVIRAAIWLADGTIALCPANTGTISASHDKDYKWIARESEYSLLLKKPVLFGAQDGADQSIILNDLGSPNVEYLVTGSKLPANSERANSLKDAFSGLVQVPFQVNSLNKSSSHLDLRLKEGVTNFVEVQNQNAVEILIDGYMNQFDGEAQRSLIVALVSLGHRGRQNKAWIIQEFRDRWKRGNKISSKTAFERMWKQIRGRKLNISSKGLALLELPDGPLLNRKDKNKYHERLGLVLRILRPDMNLKNRLLWRQAWLKKWIEKLSMDRECLYKRKG